MWFGSWTSTCPCLCKAGSVACLHRCAEAEDAQARVAHHVLHDRAKAAQSLLALLCWHEPWVDLQMEHLQAPTCYKSVSETRSRAACTSHSLCTSAGTGADRSYKLPVHSVAPAYIRADCGAPAEVERYLAVDPHVAEAQADQAGRQAAADIRLASLRMQTGQLLKPAAGV